MRSILQFTLLLLVGNLSCESPSNEKSLADTSLSSTTSLSILTANVESRAGNTFPPTLYYAGSDDEYDYYETNYRPYGGFVLNKVECVANIQPDRFQFDRDPRHWHYVAGPERLNGPTTQAISAEMRPNL